MFTSKDVFYFNVLDVLDQEIKSLTRESSVLLQKDDKLKKYTIKFFIREGEISNLDSFNIKTELKCSL